MIRYKIIYGICILIFGTIMGILFHFFQFTCIPLTECVVVSSIGTILTIICLPFLKSSQPIKLAFVTTAVFSAAICLLTVLLVCYKEAPEAWFYSMLILPTWFPLSWLLYPVLKIILKLLSHQNARKDTARVDA